MTLLPIITTATDRCRRCYSCVRGCPAKAIRVQDGQARVIPERCVSCGRCVRVCSQGVKHVVDNLPVVNALLHDHRTVIMLAPSFPAAFTEARPGQVIAALRRCGFSGVFEVGFGADLVSRVYQKLYNDDPVRMMITTPCPASVMYIQKYAVELLPYLSPVLSPMAALGKVLKTRVQPRSKTVFAGPCTAKIRELQDPEVAPWVDAGMTFAEVRQMIRDREIDMNSLADEEFDPPHAGLGGFYPMAGALLRVADLPSDMWQNAVCHVAGRTEFTEIIDKLKCRVRDGKLGDLETRFFDVMFCKGCIDGPIMSDEESPLRRKERVVEYLRSRRPYPKSQWESAIKEFSDIDMERGFVGDEQSQSGPSEEEIRQVLARTNKTAEENELNCGACGYRSCREKAIAVWRGIAEVEMCLPYMIEKLEATVSSLHFSHEKLTATQAQLIRSERLASMGQMAAGIAHEVNNPLGTILIFAHLLRENPECSDALRHDVDMILQEATRCKNIVSGLLNFARQTKTNLQKVDLKELLERSAEIVRSQAQGLPIVIRVELEPGLPMATVDKDQMQQVLLNLMRNAVEAMPDGGQVVVHAARIPSTKEFRISVSDTGGGILPENMDKLFSPFFSTKPVGKGTGLGLPICYGIVKMHRGQIRARNNDDGPGATFEIFLPGNGGTDEEAI